MSRKGWTTPPAVVFLSPAQGGAELSDDSPAPVRGGWVE